MSPIALFGRVAVLLGGNSPERAVSLKSGQAVLDALKGKGVDAHPFDPKNRALSELLDERFERVFIALHGGYGEDGTVQGALEMLGIPYTGSGVLGSALAMNKWRTKLLWQAAGIASPRFELLHRESDSGAITDRLGLPLMVKPSNSGSSIGMTKVTKVLQLERAFTLAADYDQIVVAEEFVDGTEFTVGIVGETTLPLIRIETPRGFYDYEAKYVNDDTRYIIPSGLPIVTEAAIQREALRAFATLGCRGWGRVDLILDRCYKPFFLEVNTSPGMTDHSLVPKAARYDGITFEDLCVRILELAALGLRESKAAPVDGLSITAA